MHAWFLGRRRIRVFYYQHSINSRYGKQCSAMHAGILTPVVIYYYYSYVTTKTELLPVSSQSNETVNGIT